MLGDDESFVYLAAVHALSRVVDMNRKLFIPALLEVFCGKSAIPVSLKIRAALGEVLSISLRRASDLAPLFVPSVVFGCIQICRNRVYLPQTDGIHANLSKMRLNIPSEQDLSEKPNSVIMELNQNIELYSNSADSIYFRQSAYSLLSEAIACGGWTAIKYLPDTLDIAIGTLLMEYDHQIQENQIIRRCSVFLLQYILKSLSQKLFQISNGGNYLKDIKRMLTVCSRDKDPVVAYHSQRGLYILDELVKEQFKPNEDDEIPKIRILN